MFEFLYTSQAAPLWAALGAIGVKTLDWIVQRRRAQKLDVNANMGAVTDMHKTLADNLFRTIETMKGEIAELKRDLGLCKTQHEDANKRCQTLEIQVAELQARNKGTNDGDKEE